MATYDVSGYKFIAATNAGDIIAVEPVVLQIVSPTGSGELAIRYLTDDPNDASVSLSDYNMLIDGAHINDGPLPEMLEFYGVNWTDNGTAHSAEVLTFAYALEETSVDLSFSLGSEQLPKLNSATDVTQFMINSTATRLGGEGEAVSIKLPEIPDVHVTGIIQQLFDDEANNPNGEDVFEFDGSRGSDAIPGDEYEVMAEVARHSKEQETIPIEADLVIADEIPEVLPDSWNDLG